MVFIFNPKIFFKKIKLFGTFYYRNRKVKYKGEVNEKREPNGFGELYYKNGRIKYRGYFKNGKKDGIGTSYWVSGQKIFQGKWKSNEKINTGEEVYYTINGLRKVITPNKNKFIGSLKDNHWNGYGVFYSTNKKMEGYWSYKEDKDIYICDQGGSSFQFYPKNDTIEGIVLVEWNNGDIYNGEWKKNQPNGVGEYKWKRGDFYIGEWKNGFRHGTGLYEFTNKDIYNGNWRNDKMNGSGHYTTEDGGSFYGNWNDNIYNESKKTKWFLF